MILVSMRTSIFRTSFRSSTGSNSSHPLDDAENMTFVSTVGGGSSGSFSSLHLLSERSFRLKSFPRKEDGWIAMSVVLTEILNRERIWLRG